MKENNIYRYCKNTFGPAINKGKRMIMNIKVRVSFLPVVIAVILAGCGGNTIPLLPAENSLIHRVEIMEDYFLQPGDNLDIRFYKTPELNENVTIRPDGKISLEPIGDFLAAGLTPSQLDEALTEKYRVEIKNAVITVILQSFQGQRIYVGGEVNTPMVLEIVGKINALEAIVSAGGVLEDAELSNVFIVSKGQDGQPLTRIVNLKEASKGQLSEAEYLLKPFDMVYVPKSKLAGAAQFVNHIYSFIPRNIGLSFSYQLHSDDDNN
jgi:protein involved in polysaccharide export with SLBB domain